MRLVYTAGPITAEHPSDRFQHCITAWQYALQIWKRGHGVICPQFNTLFMDSATIPWGTFMNADYQMVLRACDAMLMLPDWTESKGAAKERRLALDNGIPVFYWDGLVDFWKFLETDEEENPTKHIEATEEELTNAAH